MSLLFCSQSQLSLLQTSPSFITYNILFLYTSLHYFLLYINTKSLSFIITPQQSYFSSIGSARMTVDHKIDGENDQFPVGMRVLAVDDDPTCLRLLDTLLRRCQYNGLFLFSPFSTFTCRFLSSFFYFHVCAFLFKISTFNSICGFWQQIVLLRIMYFWFFLSVSLFSNLILRFHQHIFDMCFFLKRIMYVLEVLLL